MLRGGLWEGTDDCDLVLQGMDSITTDMVTEKVNGRGTKNTFVRIDGKAMTVHPLENQMMMLKVLLR